MKKFLIIGNMNSITNKDIFPLLKSNKVWLGVSKSGMHFVNDGKPVGVNSVWFTNLEHNKRHTPLELTERYSLDKYPKYLNYDCIEVGKVKDIPLDYNGLMGVPINYLENYCPEQFDIISSSSFCKEDIDGWKGVSEEFYNIYYAQGSKGEISIGWPLPHYVANGKAVIPYKRILIRRKQ